MLVRQKVGRYAGREFDMQADRAIANHRAGVVELIDPMPKSVLDRLEDAGQIDAEPQATPPSGTVVRRGPGRPRKSIAQPKTKMAGDVQSGFFQS